MLDRPLHPMVVHFPIALYLLGVLFTLGTLRQRRDDYERFAGWAFLLAWISGLVAALVGVVDQGALDPNDPRRGPINNHITAGIAFLILSGLVVYVRIRWPDPLRSSRRSLYLVLMAAGLIALIVAGWLGGELVYGLKVGIE